MPYTPLYAWLSSDCFGLLDLATLSDYPVQHSYIILPPFSNISRPLVQF
jgi:hypothetical protein